MKIISRYLGVTIISYILLVLFIILAIMAFVEISIQLGKVSKDYSVLDGMIYTFLKLPVYGYEVFPIAILIGTLVGLGTLANKNELIILRVSGASVFSLFKSVFKSIFIFLLFFIIIGEMVAPYCELAAKTLRSQALHKEFAIGGRSGVWLRKKENKNMCEYIHIRKIKNEKEFNFINIYHYESGSLKWMMTAKKGVWDKENGLWRLESVSKTSVGFKKLKVDSDWGFKKEPKALFPVNENFPFLMFKLNLDPNSLTVLRVESKYMNFIDLVNYIVFLKRNMLDARPYQLILWKKIIQPFTLLAMLLIVFPLVFGSIRQVSMGQRIFVGVLLGLGYHYLSQLLGNLALVYQWPVWLGVILPPLILGGIGWYGIWRLDHPK